MNVFSVLLQLFSRRQLSSPSAVRRLFVTVFAFSLLVAGVLYNNRSSFLLAQTGNPSVTISGGGSLTGYAGASNGSLSFNGSVTGAPIPNSECTVTGTGPAGPWSVPSWTWSAGFQGANGGMTVSVSPSSGSDAVSATVVYGTNPTPGTYTVRVTGSVSYTSNCGSKSGSNFKDFTVTVLAKDWTPDTPIVVTPVSPGVQGQYYIVENGSSVGLSVSATDNDKWTVGGTSGTDTDTFTYSWTGGTGGTFSNPSAYSTTWTPPALPTGATSADFTVSCRVDDTPKAKGPSETGSRDDVSVTQSRLIRVVRKVWDKDTPISGGELTAPTSTLVVEEGASVGAAVATATDSDKWTKGGTSGTTTGSDNDSVTYTWSAAFGSLSQTDGQSTTWTAPNLSEGTKQSTYTFKCTIDDTPKAIAANESGSRDDTAVERVVTVKVIQKVWDAGDSISGGGTFTVNGSASGNMIEVDPGTSLTIAVAPATDTDHWVKGDEAGDEADTLTYSWSSSAGGSSTGQTINYTAGQLPAGIDSVTVTLTCTVDDTPTPITGKDSGTRNDASKSAFIVIKTVRKVWGASPSMQGGELTSPATIGAEPGASINVAVNAAEDIDTWLKGSQSGTDSDGVTYSWSGDGGTFGATNTASTTWTAPALPTGTNTATYHLSCTIDDTPKVPGVGEGGTRNDDSITRNITVKVARRVWNTGSEIEGGELTTDEKPHDIAVGSSLGVAVSTATDEDAWVEGTQSGTDADGITYTWSGEGTFANANAASTTWTPPTLPTDVNEKTFVLTCTTDDTPELPGADEAGTRDDDAVTRYVTIKVVRPHWSPVEQGIGFHPKRDEEDKIIKPYVWLEDGRMLYPIDQTVSQPIAETVVEAGNEVPCEVEVAKDWDTFTDEDGPTIVEDTPLTYTWSAKKGTASIGKFKVQQPNGTYVLQDTASGLSATWVAPSNVTDVTNVQIQCTVDDATGDRVTAPVVGSHDDAVLVRKAQVKVLPGTGGAYLTVLKANEEPAGSNIDGTVNIALVLDLKNSKVDSSSATIRIQENPQPDHEDHPAEEDHHDIELSFTDKTNWQKFVDPDGAGPLPPSWQPAPEAPSATTPSAQQVYRYLLPWNTSGGPESGNSFRFDNGQWASGKLWNHNAPYTLSISSVDGVAGNTVELSTADVDVASCDVNVNNPTAPTHVYAISTGSHKITLYWKKVPGAVNYYVERHVQNSMTTMSPVGPTPVAAEVSYPGGNIMMWTDTGLTDGVEYVYSVKAGGPNGSLSPASEEDSDVADPTGIPYDSKNPAQILNAAKSALNLSVPAGGPTIGDDDDFEVTGPDGAEYKRGQATQQLPSLYRDDDGNFSMPDGTPFAASHSEGLDSATPEGGMQSNEIGGVVRGGAYRGAITKPGYWACSFNVQLPPASSVYQSPSGKYAHEDNSVVYVGSGCPYFGADAGLIYGASKKDKLWHLYYLIFDKGQGFSYSNITFNHGDKVNMFYYMQKKDPNGSKKRLSNLCITKANGVKHAHKAVPVGTENSDYSDLKVKRNQQLAQTEKDENGKSTGVAIRGVNIEATGSFMNNFKWSDGRVWSLDPNDYGHQWTQNDTHAITSWSGAPAGTQPAAKVHFNQATRIRDYFEEGVSIDLRP